MSIPNRYSTSPDGTTFLERVERWRKLEADDTYDEWMQAKRAAGTWNELDDAEDMSGFPLRITREDKAVPEQPEEAEHKAVMRDACRQRDENIRTGKLKLPPEPTPEECKRQAEERMAQYERAREAMRDQWREDAISFQMTLLTAEQRAHAETLEGQDLCDFFKECYEARGAEAI